MSTKIGHFEILSELAKSPTGTIYKANDPETGQTVALKAIQLSAFGENAAALEQALLAEAESTKVLSSPNITPIFGAGEMDGQFCAATEYVQGNSIATMLARKEGFSIWDLLDIGRQVCAGLDHAHSHGVVHYSLEPSKIMCGWDGTVKILGFGVSSGGKFPQPADGVAPILYYMSPEQVSGDAMDGRSNLFSLGAMFYEMVTDRKPFEREDTESLKQSIVESSPVPPMQVQPKLHPQLSALIMKALAKNPAERYQNGRELLDDLEKCKESKPAAAAAKKPESAKAPAAPPKAAAPAATRLAVPEKKIAAPVAAIPTSAAPVSKLAVPKAKAAEAGVAPKAAAAAAGVGGAFVGSPASQPSESEPELDLSNQFITSVVKATIESAGRPSPSMSSSSAVLDEPEVETFEPQAPKIAVDPMMAEGGQRGGGGTSFSEMTELPPLKEIYIEQPKPPAPDDAAAQASSQPSVYDGSREKEEKPKIQPREVAQKAIKEIKGVPPKLMLYAIAGAVGLILIIGIAVVMHIHSLNGDDDTGAARTVAEAPPQPAPSQPVASAQPVVAQPAAEVSEPEPETPSPSANSKGKNPRRKPAPVAAPVIIPGQMAIDSTPQGAQVQIDGRTDGSYVTPFSLGNLQPGQHTIIVSKSGYSTDTRAVEITAGNRASLVVHLTQLMATLVVTSDPAGASVYVDGRDMGKVTPAQFSIDKGQHVVLVRKLGYLDETMNGQFTLGQTSNFTPALRALGNAENIKTVGKMKKLFGGNGGQPGQATVSVHTTPKGAQVAINQHILEKNSPVEVMLDPGNYVVDITLTGYAPVHKVITVEKSGKVAVDEVLQSQ